MERRPERVACFFPGRGVGQADEDGGVRRTTSSMEGAGLGEEDGDRAAKVEAGGNEQKCVEGRVSGG